MQQYSNTSGVALSVGVFLATDHYDHNADPFTISTTTLIRPIRQIILSTRIPPGDAIVDIEQMWASRIGTAIHTGIETAWLTNYKAGMTALGVSKRIIEKVRINPTKEELKADPDIFPVYMEQRLSRKVGKWTITGKFDFIIQGRLEDFKTTTAYVVQNQLKDITNAKQGSIYKWLDPELITHHNMAIQYIIMDWKAAEANSNPLYPQKKNIERILQLATVAETDRFVNKQLNDIEQYWDAPEETLPLCDDTVLQRSEPVFKYYKSGDINAARSTKNFDNKQDAYIRMSQDGGNGAVKEVPGQVTGCKFCSAFSLCSQKDQLIAAGDLIL